MSWTPLLMQQIRGDRAECLLRDVIQYVLSSGAVGSIEIVESKQFQEAINFINSED